MTEDQILNSLTDKVFSQEDLFRLANPNYDERYVKEHLSRMTFINLDTFMGYFAVAKAEIGPSLALDQPLFSSLLKVAAPNNMAIDGRLIPMQGDFSGFLVYTIAGPLAVYSSEFHSFLLGAKKARDEKLAAENEKKEATGEQATAS